jgi:hypothetical protein
MGPIERGPIERGRMKRGRVVIAPNPSPPVWKQCDFKNPQAYTLAKLGKRSDEAMKRCDQALNASSLQFLC